MLKYIPILGPWAASIVEKKVGQRIVDSLIATLITSFIWLSVILIVALSGWFFDEEWVKTAAGWTVDLIYICFLVQGAIGLVSGARAALEEFNGHWAVRLTGATLIGAVQAVLIPLLGLGIVWVVISLTRFHVIDAHGGGFWSWVGSVF